MREPLTHASCCPNTSLRMQSRGGSTNGHHRTRCACWLPWNSGLVCCATRLPSGAQQSVIMLRRIHGLERAGVRHARQAIPDPKQAMYAWAMDVIQKELPELNSAMVNLCRAEQCTVIRNGSNTTTTIIFPKSSASDVTSSRHLMAHLMKICVASVFHSVEGAFDASSRGTPKL